jgi:hypothetical protein
VSLKELLVRTFLRPLAAAAVIAALAYLVARPLIQSRVTLVLALAVLPVAYLAVAFLLSAITRADLARLPLKRLPLYRGTLPPSVGEGRGGSR